MPISKQEPEIVQEKIRQLKNRQKILLNRKADAERKMRTYRLIERRGHSGKCVPRNHPHDRRTNQGISGEKALSCCPIPLV
ncbi:hypothetical protein ACVS9P_08595 [Caproicibacterium sp. NSD3]